MKLLHFHKVTLNLLVISEHTAPFRFVKSHVASMIVCSAHISSNPIKSAHKMPFTKLMSINKSKSFVSSRECCVENTQPVVHLCGTSNALYQCEIKLHPKFSCFGSTFTHSTPETGRFLITYGFSAANFYLCV